MYTITKLYNCAGAMRKWDERKIKMENNKKQLSTKEENVNQLPLGHIVDLFVEPVWDVDMVELK